MKQIFKLSLFLVAMMLSITVSSQAVTRHKRVKITKMDRADSNDTIVAIGANNRLVKSVVALSDLGGGFENISESGTIGGNDAEVIIGATNEGIMKYEQNTLSSKSKFSFIADEFQMYSGNYAGVLNMGTSATLSGNQLTLRANNSTASLEGSVLLLQSNSYSQDMLFKSNDGFYFTDAQTGTEGATLDISYLTDRRNFYFPDQDGTIALLSDIPTGGGNPEGYSNTGTLLGGDLAVFIGEDGNNADAAYINLDSPNNRVVIQSGNINLGGVLKLDDFSETPGTISSPVTGMLIIDSSDGNKLKYYNGTNWMEISAVID